MSFEVSIQPINIEIEMPGEADLEAGANALMLRVTAGMILPVQTGPGKPPAIIPFGMIKFPVGREQAESLADGLREASEKLPKASPLVTANSLEGVDEAVNFTSKLKSPPHRKR